MIKIRFEDDFIALETTNFYTNDSPISQIIYGNLSFHSWPRRKMFGFSEKMAHEFSKEFPEKLLRNSLEILQDFLSNNNKCCRLF